VHLSMEGRTSSEASSLPSSPSVASPINSWSQDVVNEEQLSLSNHNLPKSIGQILEDNLSLVAAKLAMADNARYQVRCANLERTEAQASILRSVSRREKTLELLATLKQLQDMCRRPPLEGKNGKWTVVPQKRAAVLSEVGRRLSQALEITSIPDLWTSSASSAMTSWPPIQNMHEQNPIQNMHEQSTDVSELNSEFSSPEKNLLTGEDKAAKSCGKMSSVEALRRKKRSAAEKRRQSHVRFLRNGVDDFAVEPSKLRVCNLIYEYQSENVEDNSTSEVIREPPELAKEFERLRGLVKTLWEQQVKFMEVAHELARERALLLWYIHSGHLLAGEEDMTPSWSFASGSVTDYANDLRSNASLSITSSYYSPNPSFCEEGSPMHARSMSNIGDLRLYQSLSFMESPYEERRRTGDEADEYLSSPIEPRTLKYRQSSFIKDQSELTSIDDVDCRPTESTVQEGHEDELVDVEF
jgi:hypothetical protein